MRLYYIAAMLPVVLVLVALAATAAFRDHNYIAAAALTGLSALSVAAVFAIKKLPPSSPN